MTKLDRRTMLRGMLGGATITVGLPALEVFLNAHGTAYADGVGLPRRFGTWFWGNGILPERWVPDGEGADYTLSPQLAPLENLKSDITVVTGMDVKTGNAIPHWSGPAGMLSGAPLIVKSGDDYTFSAPSIDQVIAAEVGAETRFKSLECGARPESGLSYNGRDSKNPPESSPRALFDRIFTQGFRAPGDEPVVDPTLRLRRSVLDAVMTDISRVQPRLSAQDRMRLDQHLQGVRDLERRIQRLEEDPPNLESCALPQTPAEDYPDVDGRPPLPEINAVMADLVALALACDQTRVFNYFYTYPVNNVLFPGMPAGHHRLTHDEPGDQPQVDAIVTLIIEQLAVFLERLRAVPEGDGTLLDNCGVLCTSDTGFARTHSLSDYPIVLAGSACGALRTGIHYRSPSGENTSKVLLTLVRAMGLRAASFGQDEGEVDEGLGAIEA